MTRRKTFGAIVLVLAMVATLGGCLYEIQGPFRKTYLVVAVYEGARMVSATDYDVSKLVIAVSYADEPPFTMIEWVPEDGQQQYPIEIGAPGELLVAVNHEGQKGDDAFETAEEIGLVIRPRTITVVGVVPGMLGVVAVEGE